MKRVQKRIISSLLLVFALSLVPVRLFAQSENGSGSGLSISPTRTELSISPGGSDVVRLSLRNVTAGDITAKVFINDFVSDNQSGEPQLIVDQNIKNPASIRAFLGELSDISLKKGEEKSFDIPVTIPADAAPGAYYGVVRYAAVPVDNPNPDPGQVALTASVASIVLIEVAGDIREQVEFNGINVYRENKPGTFFMSKPSELGIMLTNKGNGFARPYGTVLVKGPFGGEIMNYEVNNSSPRSNILPNSERTFREELKGVKWPGRYQITGSISYGNGGDVLIQKKTFWYMPWWSLLILLVIVLGIAYLIIKLRHRLPHTRYKRK